MSMYSAIPPQTPAIFLSVLERESFFCFFGWQDIDVPHWQQKLTFSAYSFPHFGQNILVLPRIKVCPLSDIRSAGMKSSFRSAARCENPGHCNGGKSKFGIHRVAA